MRNALCMLATLTAATSAAHAGSDSLLTLGLGSHTMVSRYAGAGAGGHSQTAMGQGFTVRLRLLKVLGGELSYDLVSPRNPSSVNVQTPSYQWSGLLYLVPTKRFSWFLLGGFGATSAGDVFRSAGATTSYHGGSGIEIGVTRNWVISAEFRVNLPGYAQVVTREKEAMLKSGGASPSIWSYYNFDSWQTNVGIRFYL